MRCLERNKRTIYYATYAGKTAVTDSNGDETGEYAVSYSAPVKMRCNVSAAKGTADLEQFGIGVDYTKTIVTSDMDCPIAEDSILWLETDPYVSRGTCLTPAVLRPHDYVVKAVAKSLNYITYAVKEVDVRG